jgi:hypothetical protein
VERHVDRFAIDDDFAQMAHQRQRADRELASSDHRVEGTTNDANGIGAFEGVAGHGRSGFVEGHTETQQATEAAGSPSAAGNVQVAGAGQVWNLARVAVQGAHKRIDLNTGLSEHRGLVVMEGNGSGETARTFMQSGANSHGHGVGVFQSGTHFNADDVG